MKQHHYTTRLEWTGNDGEGTKSYRTYRRDHMLRVEGRPDLHVSSDPAFRGDPSRYNPELLLVGSLSSCHMLWYLHLCSVANIVVLGYTDDAIGTMEETDTGSGAFTRVVLKPIVEISESSDEGKAHHFCFISNSVNFPVEIEPRIVRQQT